MSSLETLDGKSWEALVASPAALLVIGKSDCEACKAWSAELEAFLAEDRDWEHVRFGKLLIDQPGLVSFKRANPWLADVETLPFNVIYVRGEPVKRFAGGGVERLLSRLERAVGPAGD